MSMIEDEKKDSNRVRLILQEIRKLQRDWDNLHANERERRGPASRMLDKAGTELLRAAHNLQDVEAEEAKRQAQAEDAYLQYILSHRFPSARKCLQAKIGCRATPSKPAWSLYWSEGGYELTLYQPDEGPQEMADIKEALDAIGGDQSCFLNPGTKKYLTALDPTTRNGILAAIS